MSGTSSGDDERFSRIPDQIKQQAEGIGRAVGDAVGPKAEDIANRSKAAGAGAFAGVAQTAEALAALIGFALSRVVKAGIATPGEPAPRDNVSHVARSEVY